MEGIGNVLSELNILKVHICDTLLEKTFDITNRLWFTVRVTASAEFLELHDILGESACLIGKYVVNSSEFLIQIWGLDLGGHVFISIIDLPVPLDHSCLNKLDGFKCHDHGNRHHIDEKDKPEGEFSDEATEETPHSCDIFSSVTCKEWKILKLKYFIEAIQESSN